MLDEALETSYSSRDLKLFESYGEFINPAYPLFLKKLGLDRVAVKAEAATIIDSEGKSYIDCIGGYGLFNLGHNHPKIIKALNGQLSERQLLTKPFITEIAVRLAESLNEISPGELSCSYICNSGSEAIDNAIKLARLHSGKKQIIAAKNSFHGYTFGALSVSGIPSFKKLFEPMVPEIVHVPYGDIDALKQTVSANTAAILLEPIQHEAGIFLPRKSYLRAVRQLCDDKDVILILDEIKTGFGKTGYMFACEYFGIVPDILVVGKSLGGGLIPIGGLIAKKRFWKKFGLSFPMAASSFAGNTLACRTALTTIQIIQEEELLNDCRRKGALLLQKLNEIVKRYPSIFKTVNGLGLLIGINAVSPQTALLLAKKMIRQRVLMVPAFGNPSVLMIEPPLVISFKQIEEIVRRFESACGRSDRNS